MKYKIRSNMSFICTHYKVITFTTKLSDNPSYMRQYQPYQLVYLYEFLYCKWAIKIEEEDKNIHQCIIWLKSGAESIVWMVKTIILILILAHSAFAYLLIDFDRIVVMGAADILENFSNVVTSPKRHHSFIKSRLYVQVQD